MMSLQLPKMLYGSYTDVARAVRRVHAEVKKGTPLETACGPLSDVRGIEGWIVVMGPDRSEKQRPLFRPYLLHDLAAPRNDGRELQTWLADPLLELQWGGLCLVSHESKPICRDRVRSRKLLGWALRWFDDLEEAGPIFGADRPFYKNPTFCRAPTTLWMVVANPGGVSVEEAQSVLTSGTTQEVRALIERAHAALAPGGATE